MSSIEKHKLIRSARSLLSGFLDSVSSNFNQQANQNGNSYFDPMLNSARNGILDIIIQLNSHVPYPKENTINLISVLFFETTHIQYLVNSRGK